MLSCLELANAKCFISLPSSRHFEKLSFKDQGEAPVNFFIIKETGCHLCYDRFSYCIAAVQNYCYIPKFDWWTSSEWFMKG